MCRTAWTVVAAIFLSCSWAAAGDDAGRRTEIRARVAELASADEAVRVRAAESIVALGTDAVEEAARATAGLDEAAWATFVAACTSGERRCSPVPFVAAAHTAPEAHRKRLLALAGRIDPKAGRERTPEEVAAVVREFLVDRANERCTTGHDLAIAVLGHAAVPVVLAHLRGPEPRQVSSRVAYAALDRIAEPEDVPVLRELLLSGDTGAAKPLSRLQRRGTPEAGEALDAAVAAGSFDEAIAEGLESTPDRARTVKAVRAWIASRPEATESDRARVADLLGRLGPAAAGEAVGDLETWLAASAKPWAISSIATALTHLGSRRGVETLVRLVGEPPHGGRCGCPCCKGKPAPEVPAGSLCEEGFGIWERWPATKLLAQVAGPDAFVLPTEAEMDAARKAAREAAREPETTDQLVARAAAAYRTWWDASKDRLAFDPATGRWSVGE